MKFYYCLLFLLQLALLTAAQDTHYWTHQFGSRSALLGGAVLGNVRNNTATFYNPAALGFVDTANLSINANAYQSENIKVENALGQQKGFKSSYLSAVPLLIGGMFHSDSSHRLKIAYGIVSPIDFNFNATARIDNTVPVANETESPGPEEFIAQSAISSRLRETVAGLAFGLALNQHWSIGLSNLFCVRSQDFQRTQYSRMYLNNADQTLVSTSFARNVKFYNIRYVAKIGINYQTRGFSAGLAVNTPSANLFGNGSVAVDILGTNVLTPNGRQDFLGNDRQERLKTTYKSPFSIAAGVNWDPGRSHVGIALQYFGKIDGYDVMRAAPSAFVRPAALNEALSSDQYLRVKSGARPVLNVALGYEYAVSNRFSLAGSFRTDNSFYDSTLKESVGIKTELSSWNIYHFTLGGIFTKGRSQLTIGLLFSSGKDDKRSQEGNLDKPTEDNFLQGTAKIVEAKYSSFGIMLGYSFSFKKF